MRISNLLIVIIILAITYRTFVHYQSNKFIAKCADSPDCSSDVYKEITDSATAYEPVEFHPSPSVNEYTMECSRKPIETDQACPTAESKCERVVMSENIVA